MTDLHEKAFKQLYEEHYAHLCRAACRILSDQDLAREVVQDLFVDVWVKDAWQTLQSPRAYLYVAVYHRSIKFLQKNKKLVSENLIVEAATQAEHNLEFQELQRIVAKAIDSLPEKCRQVFVLSREEELSYNEIARQLNLSPKTVENQMGIALKKLRAFLNQNW